MPRGRSLSDLIGQNRTSRTTVTSRVPTAQAQLSPHEPGAVGEKLKEKGGEALNAGVKAFADADKGEGLQAAGTAMMDSFKQSGADIKEVVGEGLDTAKKVFNIGGV